MCDFRHPLHCCDMLPCFAHLPCLRPSLQAAVSNARTELGVSQRQLQLEQQVQGDLQEQLREAEARALRVRDQLGDVGAEGGGVQWGPEAPTV